MKSIRYFLTIVLLACFLVIVTVPFWKPYVFVNENLLPDSIQGLKTMRLVKGGGFNMGDATGQVSTATPVRYVKVSSFYMDETPVTVGEFQEYIDAGGTLPHYWNHKDFQNRNIPVIGVSWSLAIDYCNWRSRVEGLEPAYLISDEKDYWGNTIWNLNNEANGYRLPTEAEFEYAARGGLIDNMYPWGNTFEKTLANYDNERGVPIGNWVQLAEVNTQSTNGFGLKGMSGNVWHWCNDWYDYKYEEGTSGKNPFGPANGDVKVLRGGSWGSTSTEELTVYYRNKAAIGTSNYDIGFRCVRPVKTGIIKSLKNKDFNTKVKYDFIEVKNQQIAKVEIDFKGDDFNERLKKYLKDNYTHSIYFKEPVENQKKINPDQLASLIINVSLRYKVNPVFVTAVMIAETGMGTVSLARWANNPLAFNWEAPDLSGGTMVFASNQFKASSSYFNLSECLHDFLGYVSQSRIKNMAYSDFFDFQSYLHNEERPYFIQNVSRVYKDLLGVKLEEDFPSNNVGQLIYTNWEIKETEDFGENMPETETWTTDKGQNTENEVALNQPNETTKENEQQISPIKEQPVESDKLPLKAENTAEIRTERDAAPAPPQKKSSAGKSFYIVVKQDLDLETASLLAKQLRGRGFPEAGVVTYQQKSAIALKKFKSKTKADKALESFSELFSDIKIVALDN